MGSCERGLLLGNRGLGGLRDNVTYLDWIRKLDRAMAAGAATLRDAKVLG